MYFKKFENLDHVHNAPGTEIKLSTARMFNRIGINATVISNSARSNNDPHMFITKDGIKHGVFFISKKSRQRNTFLLSNKVKTHRCDGIVSVEDNAKITKIAFVFEDNKRRNVVFINKDAVINAAYNEMEPGVVCKKTGYGDTFQITNEWINKYTDVNWVLPVPYINNTEIYEV